MDSLKKGNFSFSIPSFLVSLYIAGIHYTRLLGANLIRHKTLVKLSENG